MGITKGKWSTLVTELLEFALCHDANLPLLDVLPSVAPGAGAQALQRRGPAHASYRDNATAKAMKRMYTVLPEVAMRPSEAYDKLVRGEVERYRSLGWKGASRPSCWYPIRRVSAIMPGERFTEATRSILD